MGSSDAIPCLSGPVQVSLLKAGQYVNRRLRELGPGEITGSKAIAGAGHQVKTAIECGAKKHCRVRSSPKCLNATNWPDISSHSLDGYEDNSMFNMY